ncbi:MAG: hypothetical protein IKW30_00710 [Lachnospiraceae bacterium]|nr:hypothetical protein [Lachnospiraceae bacterium]
MNGFIDMHCHILPGVDDGAKNLEKTREMLQMAYEEGIREIIVTPHYFATRKSASVEKIRQTILDVEKQMEEWKIGIKLYPGNEIYYRNGIEDILDEKQICTLAESKYVLVEFDPMTEYSYLRDGILKLDSYGYIPILAHTERYECLFEKKERLQRVKDHGGLIQVNASSFLGGMFDEMAKRAKYIMKNDLLDFIGTDAHSSGKRSPKIKDTASYLYKKLGEKKAEKILFHNPRTVLENGNL